MNPIITQLLSVFTGMSGKSSSMRAVMVYGCLAVVTVWAVVSVTNGKLQDIPETVVWLVATLIGGKAVQRFAEKSEKKS